MAGNNGRNSAILGFGEILHKLLESILNFFVALEPETQIACDALADGPALIG